MLKRSIGVAFAFIGVVVGAGFASGMEAFQYFVSYGTGGFWGIALAGAVMALAAVAFLTFGSFFLAGEHTRVFSEVSSSWSAKAMDWAAIAAMFCIGFVMFAGAGSNLEQAYGWPVWVGGLLMLALMLVVGRLDVDRISSIIGLATPVVIVFVLIASIWTFMNVEVDFAAQSAWVQENVDRADAVPTWWLAALNHTGLNALCAVSMAIVIGGDTFDNKAVRMGGFVSGIIYVAMLGLLVVSLFMQAQDINGDDMPLLSVVFNVNGVLGQIMTWVIFIMVFNTCLGMIYALAKRLTRDNPDRFYLVYAGSCLIGLVLSFVGFKPLVANVYPILGYLGLFVIAVIGYRFFEYRGAVKRETELRSAAVDLITDEDNADADSEFADMSLDELAEESLLDDEDFKDALKEEIGDEEVEKAINEGADTAGNSRLNDAP